MPMRYSTEELQHRADLLAYIEKMEGEAEWTHLEELQERSNLLAHIAKMERILVNIASSRSSETLRSTQPATAKQRHSQPG